MWLKQNYRMWGNFLQTLCFKLNSLKGKTSITSWSSSWAEAPRQTSRLNSLRVLKLECVVWGHSGPDLWPLTSDLSSVHPPVTEDKGARVNTTSGQCLHSASVVFSVQQLQAEWEITDKIILWFSDTVSHVQRSQSVLRIQSPWRRPHFWL